MANGDKSVDWRAVGGLIALLVGLFTVTNFLVEDKIDSKIQSHSITTEAIHNKNMTEIQSDISSLKKGQENLEDRTERIEDKIDRLLEER